MRLIDAPPLDNVIEVLPGVFSGSGPESLTDFDALASLGVRSIVSVDGARPEIDRARAHDMRYAHIPVTYAQIDEAQRAALARAIRDLPRPIYVHCHHGRHRGPAACAVALVGTGELGRDDAMALLDFAGTSPDYPGLFASVEQAQVLDADAIASAPEAPESAQVTDLVRAMADIDRAMDHLQVLQDHGWRAPTDHPDLAAPAEAGLIHDRLRAIRDLDSHPWAGNGDFLERLERAAQIARELETRLRSSDPSADLLLQHLRASCRDCHRAYR